MTGTIEALTSAWQTRLDELGKREPGTAAFIVNALKSSDENDVMRYSVETLEPLLVHTARHIGERKPGTADIRIWTPEGEGAPGVVVVDIYSADTPFIVDSALAAIRAAGGTIRFMTHPVVPVDTTQSPWTVLAKPTPETRNESVLQIHIDPPASADTLETIRTELEQTMTHVRRAVIDWRDMLERLRTVVVAYREHPPHTREPVLAEAMHFLAWLADHNFTFLGMREYRFTGPDGQLAPVEGTGLGILRDYEYCYLREGTEYVHTTVRHAEFLSNDEPLMVTKANKRALVHRRVHMDYVGVKIFDQAGTVVGELRVLGLFTSMSIATPHTDVPLIRRKVTAVMSRSGLDPRSHAGKALMNALDNYPREELFQISPDELFEFASVIATLPDRPRVRVLPRIDRFDNFVSILVYLPRDRFDSGVRARIGAHLADRYDGRISAFTPDFPEGDLARVHFIVGRNGGPTPRPERDALEAEVNEITRSFADRMLSEADDPASVAGYANAFTADYQHAYGHTDALADIGVFKGLGPDNTLAVHLAPGRAEPGALALKFYHREHPIPLSNRVPLLENFGFRVVDERTYLITPEDAAPRYLHDMSVVPANGQALDVASIAPRLEAAIVAASLGQIENDGYNRLTLLTEMGHADITILRALARYLKQVGITYSQRYIWAALANQPQVASALVSLFHTLHAPDAEAGRGDKADALQDEIAAQLEAVTSIDEDRIIRRLLNLVTVSLRTNLYQPDSPAFAIKFDAGAVEGMPPPRPFREIFVYSPRVEGVHMRGGPIARGGLRWSDRPEDFRTEILGLVKAQMVKNAVIVPVGAKGGFVPRQMPVGADRDAVYAEGTACYKIFIGALLDITDNLDDDTIVPPTMVHRRDNDDPYLVVAADKGTASFSDTANAISTARDYWLGDAFASGGSAGYDHKKMGITARGGWEAVKRHFRELDHDIQTEDFTAAGVGDMSGDVFGNGMLLSEKTKLVAAFDHRDIFIDPDPDPATSFAERKRLFDMVRSSWQDYDTGTLSPGGGIYPRTLKTIELPPQAQDLLGLGAKATPAEVMRAILKARVDLLWFGGIGTYIRAARETDADAGDRANDAIRVTGEEIGAKVIGEGANLGATQLGRIEYALTGGRINTDAIDNSAGVNSSDLEVNIKIALSGLVRSGQLTMDERNAFLVEMTEEVAGLCLRNNYLQTLALSLTERAGQRQLPDLVDLMKGLEAEGELDRSVEFLPDAKTLADRQAAGQALTRPELSVLLAYAKNTLFADLLASSIPDDPYLAKELFRYFPDTLRARYPDTIETHRLRREVIATVLANAMINRGGPAFVSRLVTMTSTDAGAVAFAYAAARDAYDLQDLNAAVDALDNKMSGGAQLALYAEIQRLQVTQALWFLRNEKFDSGLSDMVARYGEGVAQIRAALPDLVSPFLASAIAAQEEGFEAAGAPPELARRIAALSVLTLASDIVYVATRCDKPVADAAKVFFAIIETFKLGRITEHGEAIAATERFDRMALDRAMANLARALRDVTSDVLTTAGASVEDQLTAWRSPREAAIARTAETVSDLIEGELTISRLSVAAGMLSDLAKG